MNLLILIKMKFTAPLTKNHELLSNIWRSSQNEIPLLTKPVNASTKNEMQTIDIA